MYKKGKSHLRALRIFEDGAAASLLPLPHWSVMSTTDPLVSVIVPSYRRASTIQNAVGSALSQTMQDLEVVVVDDGSGDDTEAKVLELGDERVHFFAHERNLGGNAARRTAIERGRGRYVAFLDADDKWFPT